MESSRTFDVFPRAATQSVAYNTGDKGLDQLLSLISSPFQTQISTTAFLASLGTSIGATILIAIAFCFLRPLNNVVYAPRSKHADSKHAPPPIGKGPLDWMKPVLTVKEAELVEKVGLDATIFLRFTHMCRNIFVIIAIAGCGVLIPVNLISGRQETKVFGKRQTDDYTSSTSSGGVSFFTRFTPQYMTGSSSFWAYVVLAYIFDIVICFFLWHNYRAVLRLRRAYFTSSEYQASLHARTLLVTEIPKDLRSDEGLVRLVEQAKNTPDAPRAAIARNVKGLPDLVEEHEQTVRDLEAHLAKYLKDPNKLPANRPTCKAAKGDRAYRSGQKVDAIEYLTSRIKQLEIEIRQTRESVDKRNAMPYGFASYESIGSAHSVAYATRKKAPQNTKMRLAPKPHDLIWKNLPMTQKERNWQNFINNLWVALLTVVWVIPNVLSAVFLSDLAHLGSVWPAFNRSLEAHPTWWGVVQGVAAPALTSIFYFFLPSIFRRLSINAGDTTKTSRDRHVMHKLFSFFVFNNLFVYSLFSAIWTYITAVIAKHKDGEGVWNAIEDGNLFQTIVLSLISVSTFWISWVLQRNLGAAIDLVQLVNLAWGSFSRRFLSPTPRQIIELSGPQPFDYPSYYNYFLFYTCVALCFATIQPLILPVTALYFVLDSYMKKYLIMYVFITKTESGGQFWRVVFNRMLFNALFGNLIIALVVTAIGDSWWMLASMGPLPFLVLAFKWYCARTFDDKCKYYTTGTGAAAEPEAGLASEAKRGKSDRVGVRFGNPVLYKPLLTPMVHARAQHMLKSLYSGRMESDIDQQSVAGYSDVYMDSMSRDRPGKSAPGAAGAAPFEIVGEGQLDFEYYKNRPEFADALGGEGELYGKPADMLRRGSEGSLMTQSTAPLMNTTHPAPYDRSRSQSRGSDRAYGGGVDGHSYPAGYHQAMREHSPADSMRSMDMGDPQRRGRQGSASSQRDREALLGSPSRMGRSPPPLAPTPGGYGPTRLTGQMRIGDGYTTSEGTPVGTPGEETSYDYFRRGRMA